MSARPRGKSSGGAATAGPLPQSSERGAELGAGLGAWGCRWVDAVLALGPANGGRLERGFAYARDGHVSGLEIVEGEARASVAGSLPKPYKVTLQVAPFDDATWDRALVELGGREPCATAILAGQMPSEADLDAVLKPLGVSLLPARETDIVARCSCPDRATPCKHVAAVHYVVAGALDRDPLLLFELRGRAKELVMEALKRVRADGSSGVDDSSDLSADSGAGQAITPEALAPGAYETPQGDLGALRFWLEGDAGAPVGCDILRPLGEPEVWSRSEPIATWLEPAYQAASSMARDLAQGLKPGKKRRRKRP